MQLLSIPADEVRIVPQTRPLEYGRWVQAGVSGTSLHPIESLLLQRLDCLPGAFLANQLRFVKAVGRLSQCIVVAVSGAAHRGLDYRPQEPLAVAYGDVLRAPVAVIDQSAPLGLSCVERLLQGINYKVCLHGAAHHPADDKPREHIDNKGHIRKALPGRDKSEVSHPDLVWVLYCEVTVDPIQRVVSYRIRPDGPYPLSSRFAFQSKVSHQALHRAAGHSDTLAVQCPPDLLGPIDSTVGSPETGNPKLEHFILLGSVGSKFRPAQPCRMTPKSRRADVQNSASRLNHKTASVLIDEGARYFKRRSSAPTRGAVAAWSVSTLPSALAIQFFNVWAMRPIIWATDSLAAH